jgi:hypothetical protein
MYNNNNNGEADEQPTFSGLHGALESMNGSSQQAFLYYAILHLTKRLNIPCVTNNHVTLRLLQALALIISNEYSMCAFTSPKLFEFPPTPMTKALASTAGLTAADVLAKILYLAFVKLTKQEKFDRHFVLLNLKGALLNIISNSGYLFPYYYVQKLINSVDNDDGTFDHILISLMGATFTVAVSQASIKVPELIYKRFKTIKEAIVGNNESPNYHLLEQGYANTQSEEQHLIKFAKQSISHLGPGKIIYTLMITLLFFFLKYDPSLKNKINYVPNEYILSLIMSGVSYLLMLLMF